MWSKHLGDTKMNPKNSDDLRTLKAVMFAILTCCMGWATDAAAAHTFFCKATIAAIGDSSPVSLSGSLVYDMGTVGSCTDLEFNTQFNLKCAGPANSACSSKASGDANFNSAAFWCGKGVPNGSTIRAYAAVGAPVAPKGRYNAAQTKGVLINKAAVAQITYDCNAMPGTWLDNPTAGNGGHARCVRNSCNAVNGIPPAPSWVSIGTAWSSATGAAWVTDGSGNIWYGVPAHATTTIVSAAQCRWQ
jgi:hypothetical protein